MMPGKPSGFFFLLSVWNNLGLGRDHGIVACARVRAAGGLFMPCCDYVARGPGGPRGTDGDGRALIRGDEAAVHNLRLTSI